MRRAALRHPKTLALAALLGIPRTHAVGILECLFDWAADAAPQGNIGKWKNIVIAGALDWTGDPDAFVDALTEAGFLKADPTHRLLINDWHEHCENWVRAKLKANGLEFLTLKDGLKDGLKKPLNPRTDPPSPLPSLSISSLSTHTQTPEVVPPDWVETARIANPDRRIDWAKQGEAFVLWNKAHAIVAADWRAKWLLWARNAKPVKEATDEKSRRLSPVERVLAANGLDPGILSAR